MKILKVNLNNFKIDYSPPLVQLPSFSICSGSLPVKVIANNGSGKSSLVLTLSNSIPTDIKANVDIDFNIETNKGSFLFPEIADQISIIPQKWKYGLLGFYPLEEIKLSNPIETDWNSFLLHKLEIEKLNKIPSAFLSDGEKQRLMICNALCKNKSLLISDEWTSHLDQEWIEKINLIFKNYDGFHLEFHSKIANENENNLNLIHIENDASENNVLSKYLDYLNLNFKNLSTKQSINFRINEELVINGVSGELIQIIGKNGSGKTTLLKKIWKKSRANKYFINKSNSNLLFIPTDPTYHVVGPTILDELEKIISKGGEEIKSIISSILQKKLDDDVFALSFGKRKVLAIIIGLLSRYPIVAIDEPFSSIDNFNKNIILKTIEFVLSRGKMVIITEQKNNNATLNCRNIFI